MREEWKRAIFNRYMLLAVVCMDWILGRAFLQYSWGWKTQDVLTLLLAPLGLSGFTPFAGLFPMLPYALRFADEKNSGYIRYQVVRAGRTACIRGKLLAVSCSGGVMMATGMGILFLAVCLRGVPTGQGLYDELAAYEGLPWQPILFVWGGGLVLLLKLILAFLFGMVWSLVCLLYSVLTMNRYVAFTLTYATYQIFWKLLQNRWNPVWLLRADMQCYQAVWEPFAIQGTVLLFLTAVLWLLMKRSLRDV